MVSPRSGISRDSISRDESHRARARHPDATYALVAPCRGAAGTRCDLVRRRHSQWLHVRRCIRDPAEWHRTLAPRMVAALRALVLATHLRWRWLSADHDAGIRDRVGRRWWFPGDLSRHERRSVRRGHARRVLVSERAPPAQRRLGRRRALRGAAGARRSSSEHGGTVRAVGGAVADCRHRRLRTAAPNGKPDPAERRRDLRLLHRRAVRERTRHRASSAPHRRGGADPP